MSKEIDTYPKCNSPYGYSMLVFLFACLEYGNEWNPDEEDDTKKVLDSNGNELSDGDSEVIIKASLV